MFPYIFSFVCFCFCSIVWIETYAWKLENGLKVNNYYFLRSYSPNCLHLSWEIVLLLFPYIRKYLFLPLQNKSGGRANCNIFYFLIDTHIYILLSLYLTVSSTLVYRVSLFKDCYQILRSDISLCIMVALVIIWALISTTAVKNNTILWTACFLVHNSCSTKTEIK